MKIVYQVSLVVFTSLVSKCEFLQLLYCLIQQFYTHFSFALINNLTYTFTLNSRVSPVSLSGDFIKSTVQCLRYELLSCLLHMLKPQEIACI